VPDHVRHPERYTVYTLDEPLFVGQGGGDEAAANERAAAAAFAAAAAVGGGRRQGHSRQQAEQQQVRPRFHAAVAWLQHEHERFGSSEGLAARRV
jgi:hypothetical protein